MHLRKFDAGLCAFVAAQLDLAMAKAAPTVVNGLRLLH